MRTNQERGPNGQPPLVEGDVATIADWLPTKGPREQMDLLLRLLELRTSHYLDVVPIDQRADAVHVWARGPEDLSFLIDAAAERRWVTRHSIGADGKQRPECFWASLAVDGYARLEELDDSQVHSARVFVAMWFDPSMAGVRNALRNAITAAGYEPVLIDEQPASEHRIDARIFVEIRRCGALVADATGLRHSVMFEAGFAEGLGRPVIWTVRKDTVDKLPFDTRQLLHVVWETPEELAGKLQPIIENRLGVRKGKRQGR